MQRKFLLFLICGTVVLTGFFSCTKIDTTNLGADLIPAVDNVRTFADTLNVFGTQGLVTPDSTRIGSAVLQVLGNISNDPIFGKTTSNIYLQYKPTFFPYFFGNAKDTIGQSFAPVGTGFDSVVLCLSYKGFYGDSSQPQQLRVLELNPAETNFRFDSIYTTTYQPSFNPGNVLGEVTIVPTDLAKFTHYRNGKDSVNYQVRIPLNASYLNQILNNSDSSTLKPFNKDSLYTDKFKGFVVQASGGSSANGLFYISLTDPKTRLEIHYRRKNISPIDTTYSSFVIVPTSSTNVLRSATANYIKRDRIGSQFANASSNELYIQSAPGTYATLQIPALSLMPNSIIHRAELMVQQIPSMNPLLPAPSFLYLDIVDTGTIWKYKPLPFDLSPNSYYNANSSAPPFYPTNGIDHTYFGGNLLTTTDKISGQLVNYYVFNISRYVQNIVTHSNINYGLRLSAPYDLHYYGYSLPFNNRLAYGGIKIGNGNNPNYKLRLRVVYSKI